MEQATWSAKKWCCFSNISDSTECSSHSSFWAFIKFPVKDLTSHCKYLDVMDTVGEMAVLVKFSPKREKILGSLIQNNEGVEKNETVGKKSESLDNLCATRWTVKARCFQNIITHHSCLQQPW